MKNLLSCVLAVLCLAGCKTNVADVEVGPYTISVIDENVYHIQDYNSAYPAGEVFDADGNKTHFNNCSDMYLIVGKKEALLIDLSNNIKWADNAAESLRQLVAERTEGKPLTITFTHNHGDHTGMLHAFIDNKEVHYAMPEKDFSRLVERFPDLDYSFINEGHVFDLGGIEIETIEVPGHTDGSGHGVWIFNTDAFNKYADAVPHLISWIEDPANGVNADQLRIYGGHYWQRDWFPELEGKEMGISYIHEMQTLIDEIKAGTAATEPSGLDHAVLDTYFRHGMAIVVWNAEQAQQLAQ